MASVESMTAWQIHDYKGLKSLKLVEGLPIPKLKASKDILVEIKAASLNVLDVLMTEGYGKVAFENFYSQKLPLTLGRDFAGIVRAVGKEVKGIKVGDEVMGVVPPQSGTGSHAQFVVIADSCVVLKPSNLTMIEAASIPYAGLTAWSGLTSLFAGHLSDTNNRGIKVLVMGAAGGVGSIAIQLCKLWGCVVVATCATDAVSIIKPLGPDHIVDYKSPDADSRLKDFGGFDVVLDCTGRRNDLDLTLLKSCSNAKYLTLMPPFLPNLDNYGVIGGLFKNVWDLLATNAGPIFKLKTIRWVVFQPNHEALTKMRDFSQQDQLKPLIESVYPYDRTPDAYEKMKAGHSRGKIMIVFPS